MSQDSLDDKPVAVDTALNDMKLEESEHAALDPISVNGTADHAVTPNGTKRSPSSSSRQSGTQLPETGTPKSEGTEHEEILGSEIALEIEPGKAPKLSRKSSQKVISRPPPLFDDLPNSTAEAVATFQVIRDCIYGSKYMGSSEHDALGCDCSEEWSKYTFPYMLLAMGC